MSQPADKPADKPVKKSAANEWVETFVVIVEALLIAIVLRFFLFQPFSIPTASMQQTLMIGDYFIANKFVWGYGKHSFSLGRYGDFALLDFELSIQNRILGRDEFAESRPLEKQLWAGAVDTVGGPVLAKVLAQTQYRGCVAACGLAGGFDLPTTVMPFILRNVRLQGVDSVMVPTAERDAVWQRLAQLLPESYYQQAATEITLEHAPAYAADFLSNTIHGRTLVNIGQ